jgi:hypothetical protein
MAVPHSFTISFLQNLWKAPASEGGRYKSNSPVSFYHASATVKAAASRRTPYKA